VATASSAPSLLGPPASAAAVMAALRPGEAILEYLVSPSGVHVFVLRPAAVTHTLHPVNREELSSRVRLARELIAHPGADAAFEPVLEALYRDLLAPVVEKGALDGVERLLIVPHGPLVYLPFAALIDETGEFTLTRFEIAVLPSAASLPALRGSESPGGSPTAVGGLALAPMPDALPATREEASSVRRALGGKALYGRGATERATRQGLGSAPVVHIAAHASLNSANPMFSGIELARGESAGSDDDGRLEVHELLGLRIASELVFLSGCETGSGNSWATGFDRGEDYATLAQAFLYAGARNVIATLWRVDDAAAAVVAESFYQARGRWRDPVAALAEAQRAVLSDPRLSAPYYWASYEVLGAGLGRD
jgi:CHAT domain-containing protein